MHDMIINDLVLYGLAILHALVVAIFINDAIKAFIIKKYYSFAFYLVFSVYMIIISIKNLIIF